MINVWVLYQDIGNIPRSGVHLVSSFLTFNKRPLVYNRPQDQICPKLINDPSLIRATHGTFFQKLINDPGRLLIFGKKFHGSPLLKRGRLLILGKFDLGVDYKLGVVY